MDITQTPETSEQTTETNSESILDQGQSVDSATILDEAASDEVVAESAKPIEYEAFEVTEGVQFDEKIANDFIGVAQELGLTQEQAQKLVDFQAKHYETPVSEVLDEYNQTVADWAKESKEKLGADYRKEASYALKAIDKFGSPQLRELLTQTGIGQNYEVINFLRNVGKLMSEDSLGEGTQRKAPVSDAQIFYPSMYN